MCTTAMILIYVCTVRTSCACIYRLRFVLDAIAGEQASVVDKETELNGIGKTGERTNQ